jgi:hypothetical protein
MDGWKKMVDQVDVLKKKWKFKESEKVRKGQKKKKEKRGRNHFNDVDFNEERRIFYVMSVVVCKTKVIEQGEGEGGLRVEDGVN